MGAEAKDIEAVREEILRLLRQQMEALDAPLGLTDARLSECYERQGRVQELREKLQALSNSSLEAKSERAEAAHVPSHAAPLMPASLDAARNV
jgi:hypothetical protein